MQENPTLLWKFTGWLAETFPESAVALIAIGLVAGVFLVRSAVRYAKEVRERSPFETL